MILDIRSHDEFSSGHLAGAVHVPTPVVPKDDASRQRLWDQLLAVTVGRPKDSPIYVYCKKGRRAGIAKQMLEQMGFRNVTNIGGVKTPDLQTAIARGELTWWSPT